MAMIKCAECGNDVSSQAAACPKCGAPPPKVRSEDAADCPWCDSEISSRATVCPHCHARKGYSGYGATIHTRDSLIAKWIFLPIVAIVLIGMIDVEVENESAKYMFMSIFGMFVFIGTIKLMLGPKWYKSSIAPD
jgi:RNA polymerase subunit RPABC4/transcription elongation factor Spt4